MSINELYNNFRTNIFNYLTNKFPYIKENNTSDIHINELKKFLYNSKTDEFYYEIVKNIHIILKYNKKNADKRDNIIMGCIDILNKISETHIDIYNRLLNIIFYKEKSLFNLDFPKIGNLQSGGQSLLTLTEKNKDESLELQKYLSVMSELIKNKGFNNTYAGEYLNIINKGRKLNETGRKLELPIQEMGRMKKLIKLDESLLSDIIKTREELFDDGNNSFFVKLTENIYDMNHNKEHDKLIYKPTELDETKKNLITEHIGDIGTYLEGKINDADNEINDDKRILEDELNEISIELARLITDDSTGIGFSEITTVSSEDEYKEYVNFQNFIEQINAHNIVIANNKGKINLICLLDYVFNLIRYRNQMFYQIVNNNIIDKKKKKWDLSVIMTIETFDVNRFTDMINTLAHSFTVFCSKARNSNSSKKKIEYINKMLSIFGISHEQFIPKKSDILANKLYNCGISVMEISRYKEHIKGIFGNMTYYRNSVNITDHAFFETANLFFMCINDFVIVNNIFVKNSNINAVRENLLVFRNVINSMTNMIITKQFKKYIELNTIVQNAKLNNMSYQLLLERYAFRIGKTDIRELDGDIMSIYDDRTVRRIMNKMYKDSDVAKYVLALYFAQLYHKNTENINTTNFESYYGYTKPTDTIEITGNSLNPKCTDVIVEKIMGIIYKIIRERNSTVKRKNKLSFKKKILFDTITNIKNNVNTNKYICYDDMDNIMKYFWKNKLGMTVAPLPNAKFITPIVVREINVPSIVPNTNVLSSVLSRINIDDVTKKVNGNRWKRVRKYEVRKLFGKKYGGKINIIDENILNDANESIKLMKSLDKNSEVCGVDLTSEDEKTIRKKIGEKIVNINCGVLPIVIDSTDKHLYLILGKERRDVQNNTNKYFLNSFYGGNDKNEGKTVDKIIDGTYGAALREFLEEMSDHPKAQQVVRNIIAKPLLDDTHYWSEYSAHMSKTYILNMPDISVNELCEQTQTINNIVKNKKTLFSSTGEKYDGSFIEKYGYSKIKLLDFIKKIMEWCKLDGFKCEKTINISYPCKNISSPYSIISPLNTDNTQIYHHFVKSLTIKSNFYGIYSLIQIANDYYNNVHTGGKITIEEQDKLENSANIIEEIYKTILDKNNNVQDEYLKYYGKYTDIIESEKEVEFNKRKLENVKNDIKVNDKCINSIIPTFKLDALKRKILTHKKYGVQANGIITEFIDKIIESCKTPDNKIDIKAIKFEDIIMIGDAQQQNILRLLFNNYI